MALPPTDPSRMFGAMAGASMGFMREAVNLEIEAMERMRAAGFDPAMYPPQGHQPGYCGGAYSPAGAGYPSVPGYPSAPGYPPTGVGYPPAGAGYPPVPSPVIGGGAAPNPSLHHVVNTLIINVNFEWKGKFFRTTLDRAMMDRKSLEKAMEKCSDSIIIFHSVHYRDEDGRLVDIACDRSVTDAIRYFETGRKSHRNGRIDLDVVINHKP